MEVSELRAPRLEIMVNGAPLGGAFAAEVISNNHLAADRFTVHAAIPSDSMSEYADTPDQLVDVRMALNGDTSTSLVQGNADRVEIDAISSTVRFDGRDFSAQLIEARTRETFANQTSSDIAMLFAGRHNLAADVETTTTPVGRYWEIEHDSITLDQFSRARSEWDLLVALAGHENFDVWVTGQTLHFRAPSAAAPTAIQTLRAIATLSGQPNITTLRLERALTLARDIVVTVKSWNSRQSTAFTQTARASGIGGGGVSGLRSTKPLEYVFVVPNLTPEAALQMAQRKLAEISSHERIVVAEMPGELSLMPRTMIALEGTESSFDSSYIIDEIIRRFDMRRGFSQIVRARQCNAS